MTEGVEVSGDGAYGRIHLHSAYAHVALALSQLFQSGGKAVEPGEVVRLEARYQPGLRSTQGVLLLQPRRSLVERPNLGPRLVFASSSTLSRRRWKKSLESPPKRPFGACLGATLPW